MPNLLVQRTVSSLLTNKSGGAVAYGDVVILGTATAKAFTTTTTAGYNDSLVGVVLEPAGIANDAIGKVATAGWVPKINLSSAAALYDLIKTHTVAKQGAPHAAPFVAGDFAVALQASTTPEAILFGVPSQHESSNIEDIPTAETDTDLRLAPDGAGGVEWVAGDGGSSEITLISEQTPSGTGTASFTSIPSTYRHLKIEIVGRSTKSANDEYINIEFNGDTTVANYRYGFDQIYANALKYTEVGDGMFAGRVPAANAPANSPGVYTFDIPYYKETTFNKVISGQGGMRYDAAGTQLLVLYLTMEWENTAAINQIDLKLATGNWVAGTKIALYGVS